MVIFLLFITKIGLAQSGRYPEARSDESDDPLHRIDTIPGINLRSPLSKEVLIPYVRKGKWGLADTLGKIIIRPQYDSIINYTGRRSFREFQRCSNKGILMEIDHNIDGYYLIRQGNKYGVVSKANVILPPTHYEIGFIYQLFIAARTSGKLSGDDSYKLYNRAGKPVFDDAVKDILMLPGIQMKDCYLFFVTFAKSGNAIIVYNYKKNEVQYTVIKAAENLNVDFCTKNRTIVTKWGKHIQDHSYELLFDSVTLKYKLVDYKAQFTDDKWKAGSTKDRREDRATDSPDFYEMTYTFFEKDSKMACSRKLLRKNKKPSTDTLIFSPLCDSFNLVKNVNLNSYSFRKKQPIDSSFAFNGYFVFSKEGKKGIIAGENVIDAVFAEVRKITIDRSHPSFLVAINKQERLYWGVIDALGNYIYPCIYDSLVMSSNPNIIFGKYSTWVLVKDKLYGIGNPSGQVIVVPQHEKIEPIYHDNFGMLCIFNKGRYAYYEVEGPMVSPLFRYKVTGWYKFNGYRVYELVDNNGKFVGYADDKGREYFGE